MVEVGLQVALLQQQNWKILSETQIVERKGRRCRPGLFLSIHIFDRVQKEK